MSVSSTSSAASSVRFLSVTFNQDVVVGSFRFAAGRTLSLPENVARGMGRFVTISGPGLAEDAPSLGFDESEISSIQSRLPTEVWLTDPEFGYTPGADVQAALQDAINTAGAGGSVTVVIPPGTFTKLDTSPSITVPAGSHICIRGFGNESVIYHYDTAANARKDLFRFDGAASVRLVDFKVLGTLDLFPNQTNQSQTFGGLNVGRVVMHGVTIEKVRYMATSFTNVDEARVFGCRIVDVCRDGLRFANSRDVQILGCRLKRVGDDSIALNRVDGYATTGESCLVMGNIIEDSQGIKALGGKKVAIKGNHLHRILRSPVYVRFDDDGTKGSNVLQIDIEGNTLTDCFGSYGTNSLIYVGSSMARNSSGATGVPGITSAPYSYNYANDLLASGVVMGVTGVKVRGNTIARTLPNVSKYSDWGYGTAIDRQAAGSVFIDPPVTDADFAAHGITIEAPAQYVDVESNSVSGLSAGYAAINFRVIGTSNVLDYVGARVRGNTVFDCPGVGFQLTAAGSGVGAKHVDVTGNLFDLDPFFRAATHSADNTWTTSGSVAGLNISGAVGIVASGNTFKNQGRTGLEDSSIAIAGENIVHADWTGGGSGDNAGNKGVRYLPAANLTLVLLINGDPTSSTYGQINSTPLRVSSAMPTSGRYLFGHTVRKSNPSVQGTSGSEYVTTGWWRNSNGSNHVLGTDWIEMRSLTGT